MTIFIGIVRELDRVCRNDTKVHIAGPHPRCEEFIMDPIHVRPVTPEMMEMFSKKNNILWRQQGVSITPLTLYCDINSEMIVQSYALAEPYMTMYSEENVSNKDITTLKRT